MISYALSTGAFGLYVTEAVASAIRKSKFCNYETHIVLCANEDEESRSSVQCTRELIKEGVLRTASVHLPYNGDLYWDPSVADETIRRDVSARLIRLIRENADLMAPMVTLHASYGGIPQEEHPYRLDQACKTIEELIPTARELGFVINVEYLPRQCIGNSEAELQQFLTRFDAEDVGICLDVNHIMNKYMELPGMIDRLAPRIRSFHICDYDGVDETHWMPGQGIHDWRELMKHIRMIDHDILLILETGYQLKLSNRPVDPQFAFRQNERAVWFLENCENLVPQIENFRMPGN
jgi:sugar phosphate isomerase/epimerase